MEDLLSNMMARIYKYVCTCIDSQVYVNPANRQSLQVQGPQTYIQLGQHEILHSSSFLSSALSVQLQSLSRLSEWHLQSK